MLKEMFLSAEERGSILLTDVFVRKISSQPSIAESNVDFGLDVPFCETKEKAMGYA